MNPWVAFVIGLVTGVGGYFLYEKYFSTVYKLGETLLGKAKGDVQKAFEHIAKLI